MNISSCATIISEPVYTVLYYTFLYLIAVVCLVGNSVIIYSVISNNKLRTITNTSILSLAISDCVQGIIYPVYNTLQIVELTMGVDACSWLIFCVCVPQTVSAYNLVLITVVRYLAIANPVAYRQWFSKTKQAFVLLLIWLYGLLSTVALYMVLKGGATDASPNILCRYENMHTEDYFWHVVVGFFFNRVLIPVFIMAPLYVCIVYRSRKQRKIMQRYQGNVSSYLKPEMMKRDIRLAKMAAFLLGYFILSWAPLFIYIAVAAFTHAQSKYVSAATRLLSFTNAAVNVFIYAGRNPDFRKTVFKYFGWVNSLLKKCQCCCPASEMVISNPREVSLQSVSPQITEQEIID